MNSLVTVIVVTWQSEQTIRDCLASIPSDCRVVVVDNASSDETLDVIRQVRGDATVIVNSSNHGFAAAVNQALAQVATPYALLLNPDAWLGAQAAALLVAHLQSHPTAAAASALVLSSTGSPERFAAGWEPTLGRVVAHELALDLAGIASGYYSVPAEGTDPAQRDWVAGTAVAMRTSALDNVGTFDESFFLYCEDMDLCARLRSAGWSIWVVPSATAVHGRAVSVERAGAWVDEHRIGSFDRYFARRHRVGTVLCFRVVRVFGLTLRSVGFAVAYVLTRRAASRRRAAQRLRDARLAGALFGRRY